MVTLIFYFDEALVALTVEAAQFAQGHL